MGWALITASTVIGLAWLSLALARLLTAYVSPAGAAALVALIFLAPGALWAAAALLKARRAEQTAVVKAEAVEFRTDRFAQVAAAAGDIAARSPLTVLALATVVGVVAARYPTARTLLGGVFTASK